MNRFALRYICLLRMYSETPQSNTTTCFIIDDIVLEKGGVRMEGISRIFDHVKGRCVLGYKLLHYAFFDDKTTIPSILSRNPSYSPSTLRKKRCLIPE